MTSIISRSDGCVRDAENLLGQLLALGEKKITMEIASLVLPVSRLPLAAEILAVWTTRACGHSFTQIEELETQGIPMIPLFDDLISAVRFLLIAADSLAMRQKLTNGDDGEKKLATLVATYEPAELSDMALMLMERRRDAKAGADPRFCLELAASAVCLNLLPHAQITTTPPPSSAATPVQQQNGRQPPPSADKEAPAVSSVETGAGGGISTIHSSWPKFLSLIEKQSTSLTFILKLTQPIALNGAHLTLAFAYPFHKEKILDDLKSRKCVIESLREATGMNDLEIDGVVRSEDGEAMRHASRITTPHPTDIVSNILNAFGGQVVEKRSDAG